MVDSPRRFLNWIDGQACEAEGGEWLESENPAFAETWALVPASGESDVARAVEAAGRAFRAPSWRGLTASERAGLLRRVGDLMADRVEELAALETRDNGKAIRETVPEISAVREMFHYWAGAADKIQGETVNVGPASFNFTRHEPIGIVAAISLPLGWPAPQRNSAISANQ